uniref:KAP NTPase domain-containing protein n=1 Tax=Shewanella eurypsychrophilus TaxID=2593656 RepID=A0A7S9IZR0_9GAMM
MQNTNASIALCGVFGVGKSSIIKCLVNELESTDFRDRKFIHCNIDCWGVNTSDITQFVLSNIIDKINNEIDMSAFKNCQHTIKKL